MSGIKMKTNGTASRGNNIPHTTISVGRFEKSHSPSVTSVFIPAYCIANTPKAWERELPRLLKLARIANVVASMFLGHILYD
tara:strand:- start:4664 stop:4909 length:246 start_codon:yes stop_codon:yes gene_type:complete